MVETVEKPSVQKICDCCKFLFETEDFPVAHSMQVKYFELKVLKYFGIFKAQNVRIYLFVFV